MFKRLRLYWLDLFIIYLYYLFINYWMAQIYQYRPKANAAYLTKNISKINVVGFSVTGFPKCALFRKTTVNVCKLLCFRCFKGNQFILHIQNKRYYTFANHKHFQVTQQKSMPFSAAILSRNYICDVYNNEYNKFNFGTKIWSLFFWLLK